MNIALFASAFHPHVGGVEELVRQLAHQLRRMGHNVIIVTNRWPRSLPAYEEFEGLPLYRLAMRVPEGSLKARMNYMRTHRSIRNEMLGILKRHHIDLLHVQCISSNGCYALSAKQALGLPLLVTAQGELTMDAGGLYQRPSFMNRMLPTLLAEADYITGCSQKTLQDVEAHVGRSFREKAQPVFNGVNLQDFAEGCPYLHTKPYMLGIGRLVPQKGFDTLLLAYAQSGVSSHDLLIAGEGPERSHLQTLAQTLGLQKRVHFQGRADRATAISLFKGCSFVVLPSRADEGLPVVSVETMAAGKALVAARVGGVPEAVVEGETGLLVPPEDVDALAQAITRLAKDEALRQRLGAAGLQRAKCFAWPVIAEDYLHIYRRIAVRG